MGEKNRTGSVKNIVGLTLSYYEKLYGSDKFFKNPWVLKFGWVTNKTPVWSAPSNSVKDAF